MKMRVMAGPLLSVLLLSANPGKAQTAGLQSQVAQAVARDIGIHSEDLSTQFGLQIQEAELQVPGQARLHVAAVHAVAGAGAWLLRMECSARLECLPFEVVLRARGQDSAFLTEPPARPSTRGSGNRPAAPLVRAGQRVQLAEEISGMRLSAPAVCLEAGGMGQRIRVRNVSSGRVVLARVRAAGQVMVEE